MASRAHAPSNRPPSLLPLSAGALQVPLTSSSARWRHTRTSRPPHQRTSFSPTAATSSHQGPRGPAGGEHRHVEHLFFDFNTRYIPSKRRNLGLAHLSQGECSRDGISAMRAYLDFQLEMDKVAQGDDTCLDLLRAACLVSLDPNIPQTLQKVEGVAAMVMRHMRPSFGPEETVRCINAVLYDWYGFKGAQERYYHPDSCNLARMLQYKTGGPTLLGLLYIAVAERVGLRTAAISLPSHFLVKPLDLPGDVYIDPYNGGRLYDTRAVGRLIHRHLHLPPPEQAAAAEALRSAVTPTPEEARKRRRAAAAAASAQPVPGPFGYGKYSCDPAYNDEYDSEEEDDTAPMFVPAAAGSGAGADMWFAPYLQPVGKREVLLRLLRNLREVYWVALVGRKNPVSAETHATWQAEQALSVLRLLRLAQPQHEEHVVAEAACLAAVERRQEAGELLQGFLAAYPEALGAATALHSFEAEGRALARVAAMEKERRDREAAAAAEDRRRRMRLAGLKGFNGRDPNSFFTDPSYYSRIYGRLWDDNYWISAMLDNQQASGDGKGDGKEEGGEDGKGKGKGGGKGGGGR